MTSQKTILVADDDLSIRTVLSVALKRAGYNVQATDNGTTLYKWVSEGAGDLVITDVKMPGENGLDLIPKIHSKRPGMKVIVISAQNALTTGISANEKGALDFLPKPFDVDVLIGTVQKALQQSFHIAEEQNNQQEMTADAHNKKFVVGQSISMQEIYRTIARLRNSDLTVLIKGESGTGKEVIARALHQYSQWKKGPFIPVNMAAIPKELIESELFGHEKGAFTGASQRAEGKFKQAEKGTIFLDEIGDMPFEAQTRLLRVLQEGEFTTVGGRQPVKADVRVIAATHQDLAALVSKGSFREDLFYRLNVVPLNVPPLRERREDIAPLVQHFVTHSKQTKVFEKDALEAIEKAPWRGNIRELENFIKRLIALHPQEVIDVATIRTELAKKSASTPKAGQEIDFTEAVGNYIASVDFSSSTLDLHRRCLERMEKPLIEQVLLRTSGNQIKAASILGINRNTLRSKMRDLKIQMTKESFE